MPNLSYFRNLLMVGFILILIGCKKETATAPTAPIETPQGTFVQKIAFVNNDSEYVPKIAVGDLYNNAGTFKLYNVKTLINGGCPIMSKDQSWIVYIPIGVNGSNSLRRINIDGSNDIQIPITPSSLFVQTAHISPDNNSILLTVGDWYSGCKLGIIPAAGGEFKTVYSQIWDNADWSPDSKRIFFSYNDNQNRFGHNIPPLFKTYIASINPDGTDLKFISDTTNGLSDDFELTVSPDGNNIAFVSERTNYPAQILPEIFSMDINGHNVIKVAEGLTSLKNGDHYDYYTMDYGPRWLIDNTHIIFQRNYQQYDNNIHQYTNINDLYVVNKDGTGLQNVTNNGKSSVYKKYK
jgi:Tol biopolymer transport system component